MLAAHLKVPISNIYICGTDSTSLPLARQTTLMHSISGSISGSISDNIIGSSNVSISGSSNYSISGSNSGSSTSSSNDSIEWRINVR